MGFRHSRPGARSTRPGTGQPARGLTPPPSATGPGSPPIRRRLFARAGGGRGRLAPAAPLNLTASAPAAGIVELTWDDASEVETAYEVERSTATLPWTRIAELPANSTRYRDGALVAGQTYRYRVRARNEVGASLDSNEISVTTAGAPPLAPSAPTGLVATGLSSSGIRLAWTPGAGGGAVGSYRIERSPAGAGAFVEVGSVAGSLTAYNDAGLSPSTAYEYRVRARNETGDSDYSNTAGASTQAPPLAAPSAPTALTAAAQSSTAITLSWTAGIGGGAVASFRVERSPAGAGTFAEIGSVAGSVLTYSDSGLSPSTAYDYRVRARNATADSAYSNTASASTQAPPLVGPSAPTALTAVASSATGIALSWTAGVGGGAVASFRVERSAAGANAFAEVGSVAGSATSFADAGLTASTTYDYRVRARNAAGDSAYSNLATATTQATAPAAPTALAVTSTTPSAVALSWQAGVGGATVQTYRIERSTGGAAFVEVASVAAGLTTYTDPQLAAATTYDYRVRARGASGDSAYSNTASGTTKAATWPAPPLNFTATGASGTTMALSWAPGITGGASVSYLIQRSLTGANAFTDVVFLSDPTAVAYTDTNLSPSTTYDYRIRARNPIADSSWSLATGSTLAGGLAAPTNLAVTAVSSSQINGTFVDNSSGETGFEVQWSADGTSGWAALGALAANATSFSHTGLTAGTLYYYRVRALGTASPSAWSNVASTSTQVVVSGPPAAPTGLSASGTSSSTISLGWSAGSGGGSVVSYRVERSAAGAGSFTEIGSTAGGITSYGDSGLTASTTYDYRVRARNASGDSAYSAIASGTTAAAGSIAAPRNLQIAAVDGRVEVALDDTSAGTATPVIEYSTDNGSTWTPIAETTPGTTWAMTPDVGRNTTVRVRAKAVGAGGSSEYVGPASVTTRAAGQNAGTRPCDVVASAVSPTEIRVQPRATAYAVGGVHSYYQVEYGTDGVNFPGTAIADGVVTLSGLSPETQYFIRVRDRLWFGALSVASPVVTARTFPESWSFGTAPTGLTATLSGNLEITLAWTNAGAGLGVLVERTNQGPTAGSVNDLGWMEAARLAPGTTQFVDRGLAPHCYYTYRVRHISEGGWSVPSAPSAERFTGPRRITTAAPGQPASLAGLPSTASEVYLWWTVNDDREESFAIEVSPAGQNAWQPAPLAKSGSTVAPRLSTDAYIGGLSPQTAYDFRIRARNTAGDSAWRSTTASVTTLAAGKSWAYDGNQSHAPRLLVSPRWKQGLLQGKADYEANRQTTARYAYERLFLAGTWPANGYWPYLHSHMVLYYVLTGDAAVAQRAYQMFDVGSEAMGQPYNPNARRMFGATGTITAVTSPRTFRVSGLPTDLVSRLYVAESLGGLVSDRVTFNTGGNATVDQPGWLITAATAVDASTYDLTLATAPAQAIQVGDSLTIFHRYQWWQNEVRDRSIEMIAAYEFLYPALTAAQRQKFLNFLNNLIDLAVGNNTTTQSRKTNRINDSDAVMGTYFGAAALDVITAPLGNTRAGGYLSQTWLTDEGETWPAGGLARTTGTISSTYRNAVGQYADSSRSGEWVESSMYNGGTMLYAIWGTTGLRHALGVEHFPEYAELKRTYAATMIHRWAPNLNYYAHWGDEQFSSSSVRKLQGVHVIWISSAAAGGQGDLRYEPYLAEMLHQIVVLFPGTAKDPFSQGRAQQPRFQYQYDFTTPRAPLTGAPRLWVSPEPVRRRSTFHRDGWADNDSWFFSLNFGDTMVDHELHALNPFELVRKQERVFTGYQGYSGGFLYANYREEGYSGGIVTAGLVRGDINGALHQEGAAGEYVYTSGSHYGHSVFEANARPPACQLERTRRLFYFPSTSRTSDVIVSHDRVLMRNPFRVYGVGGYIKQVDSSFPGLALVKAAPAPTTTTVTLALESSYANKWKDFRVWFKSGPNEGIARYVVANTQGAATTTLTLDRPLPVAPAAGDFCHLMYMDSQQAWLQRQVDYNLGMVEQCVLVPPGRTIDLSSPSRVAWTTAGGQQVAVDQLLPETTARDATSVVLSREVGGFFRNARYQDDTAAEDYDNPSENFQQVRISPLPKWPADDRPVRNHFLAVWSGCDPGTAVNSVLIRSNAGAAIEAAHVRRPLEDDVVAGFSSLPVDRTVRTGFTLDWTASRGTTRVYLADLDPLKTWTAAVDGAATPMTVSSGGVGRLTVAGSGAHRLVVTAAG